MSNNSCFSTSKARTTVIKQHHNSGEWLLGLSETLFLNIDFIILGSNKASKRNETLMTSIFHYSWICKIKRCRFSPIGNFTCYFTIPLVLVEFLSTWVMNKNRLIFRVSFCNKSICDNSLHLSALKRSCII